MINFNGDLVTDTQAISVANRGLNYGDAVFETLRWNGNRVLFFEDHYFRLMASMRILRMEIPMAFTMAYLQQQIKALLERTDLLLTPARLKCIVFRQEGGLYTPKTQDVSFIISAKALPSKTYSCTTANYVVDLFKDHYVAPSLLSTLKTNNKALHVLASIYAKENDFDNCLLLNTNKQIIEATNGNLFLVKGQYIKTPPLTDGCLNGILRKQLLNLLKKASNYTIEEASISPFELQKADELFITNVIVGIQPITRYRKKNYTSHVSKDLTDKLNALTV